MHIMAKYKYKRIRLSKTKFIDKHRLIMEKHIGRELSSNEIVHHINGDSNDDKIENLEILTRSEHTKKHIKVVEANLKKGQIARTIWGLKEKKKRTFSGEKYRCTKCKEIKHKSEFMKNCNSWNKLEANCRICKIKRTKEYYKRKKAGII